MKQIKLIGLILLVCAQTIIAQQHFLVTRTADDSNLGSLRWAINNVNNGSSLSYIDFNVPGSLPIIFSLEEELPAIEKPVVIDGLTQLPYNIQVGSEPKVWLVGPPQIDGNYQVIYGLNLKTGASFSTIKNISIQNFEKGLLISGSSNNRVLNNVIFNTTYTVNCTGSNNEFYGNVFGSNRSGKIQYTSKDAYPWENFEILGGSNNIIGNTTTGNENQFWNMSAPDYSLFLGSNYGNKISGNLFNYCSIINQTPLNGNINFLTNPHTIPSITQARKFNQFLQVSGTGIEGDTIEVFLTNGIYDFNNFQGQFLRKNYDIIKFIGMAIVNSTDVWILEVPYNSSIAYQNAKYVATATYLNQPPELSTTDFSDEFAFDENSHPCCENANIGVLGGSTHLGSGTDIYACLNAQVTFSIDGICNGNQNAVAWNVNGTNYSGLSLTHAFNALGDYSATAIISDPNYASCPENTIVRNIHIKECPVPDPCDVCISSFTPQKDSTYVISAWVSEENSSQINFAHPYIEVRSITAIASNGAETSSMIGQYYPQGLVIDGWQRIEESFEVPHNALRIKIELKTTEEDAYFDDVRVFPINGNMKSFVYDPLTLRFVAELDENNYATFYEYDEEGKLIRLKKETERGIMTIRENRNSTKKKQ